MNLEDVSTYTMDPNLVERLLAEQRECTFAWVSGSGRPGAVTMSYLWRDGAFWLATVRQRKRVAALLRRPWAAIVISGAGTSIGPGKSLTYQGPCHVLDDSATKAWYFDALAEATLGPDSPARAGFVTALDTPNRVILRLVAERLLNSYDGARLRAAMASGE